MRLDSGDDIVASVTSVCEKEGIRSALVGGIGACRKASVSHFDTVKKEYHETIAKGMLEIVSLSGNVSMLEGKPLAHLHIALGKPDFSVVAGHLGASEVNPTCEITLFVNDISVERKKDEKSGLNLQAFGD